MTNRLLVPAAADHRQAVPAGRTREQPAPSILVIGIIGLVGPGPDSASWPCPPWSAPTLFFSAGAGCSGQQTGTTGQPTAGTKAKVDPGQLPVLVPEGRPAVRRAVDDPGRDRHGGKRQRPDHPARRAQRVQRVRRGGPDADRHRRRGRQRLGRRAGPPGQRGGQRRRDRRGRRPERQSLRSRRRDRGRREVPARARVQTNPSAAIFAYNHLQSYVQSVLYYAGQYAGGNFSVVAAQPCRRQLGGRLSPAGRRTFPRSARRTRAWPPPSPTRSSSSASRTCGAAPGRTPSTAPAWS